MEAPYLLLVTGPAGAGKTTVADRLARSSPVPAAHIALDDVRDWLKSAPYDPATGGSHEAEAQYALARGICADAARRYRARGIATVIDDVVFPDPSEVGLAPWLDALGMPEARLAVLLPPFATVAVRNRLRPGARRVGADRLRAMYDAMAAWRDRSDVAVLDNADLTADEAAARLYALATGPGTPARAAAPAD